LAAQNVAVLLKCLLVLRCRLNATCIASVTSTAALFMISCAWLGSRAQLCEDDSFDFYKMPLEIDKLYRVGKQCHCSEHFDSSFFNVIQFCGEFFLVLI